MVAAVVTSSGPDRRRPVLAEPWERLWALAVFVAVEAPLVVWATGLISTLALGISAMAVALLGPLPLGLYVVRKIRRRSAGSRT